MRSHFVKVEAAIVDAAVLESYSVRCIALSVSSDGLCQMSVFPCFAVFSLSHLRSKFECESSKVSFIGLLSCRSLDNGQRSTLSEP